MGKAFRHRRNKSDYYQTPYGMTRQLLEVEEFAGAVLDPCAGGGAIVREIERHGLTVTGADIVSGFDFLEFRQKVANIITNPPYSLVDEFIEHAGEVCQDKYAMLIKLTHITGLARFENQTFREMTHLHIFTRQANLSETIRDDGRYPSGMYNYAWAVFKPGHNNGGTFTASMLNNQEWILRKDVKNNI